MMILVRLIDLFVEYVKLLGGSGPLFARILAWAFLLAVVAVVIGLVVWGITMIPALIDALNGT